jgi:MFS family permease
VSNYHWLFAVAPLMAIFNGLSFANMPTIVSRVAPDGNRGEALGISSSVQALAQGILAAMSGYIASISQSKVVLTGAAVVLLGQIAFWVFFGPQRHRKTEHDHPEFAGSH